MGKIFNVIMIIAIILMIIGATYKASTPSNWTEQVVSIQHYDDHQLVELYYQSSTTYMSVSNLCPVALGDNVTISETLGAWWIWPSVPEHILGC